jgi:hypothetical protein
VAGGSCPNELLLSLQSARQKEAAAAAAKLESDAATAIDLEDEDETTAFAEYVLIDGKPVCIGLLSEDERYLYGQFAGGSELPTLAHGQNFAEEDITFNLRLHKTCGRYGCPRIVPRASRRTLCAKHTTELAANAAKDDFGLFLGTFRRDHLAKYTLCVA